MSLRPDSLKGRIVKLERLCGRRSEGGRFFMIWGRDDADLERKLNEAKSGDDLSPGDRFDAKIWTSFDPPPLPRWTRLDEMGREELVLIVGGEDREDDHLHQSVACQWSDADLSDFYADSLPRFA
jgi:hypothetical protein